MTNVTQKHRKACDLQSCFLCRMCMEEWGPSIGAYRQNLSFRKGELIFSEGDPVNGIYFVYSGFVKVHKHWGNDKELIIRFAGKGDIFGHRGLGDSNKTLTYPISATALEPLTVCYIDLNFLQASLKANFSLVQSLLNFYAEELQESENNMRDLAHMPVKGRIAHNLLMLQQKFGNDPDGTLTFNPGKQDLASFSGTTYETAFRVLSEFSKEGWIGMDGKHIRILQPDQLRDQSSSKPI